MLAILNYLNALYFPIFQPILMVLVSKFMVQRALSDITYILLGLLSPLKYNGLSYFKILCDLTGQNQMEFHALIGFNLRFFWWHVSLNLSNKF